jgi:hypothetical protein
MDVQFDKAEFNTSAASASQCFGCATPIAGEYYEVNGQTFCAACTADSRRALGGTPGASGFFKALAGGIGGGIVGALIYYAVLALSGYEIGIIAIAVGFLVGKGVNWGTGGRGGPLYQAMAIVLTYVAIVSTYVPMVIQGLRESSAQHESAESTTTTSPTTTATPAPATTTATPAGEVDAPGILGLFVGLIVFALLVLALPFLAGFQNILGLFIIGIGLYEAWKINKRVPFTVSGPFHARMVPPVPPPSPAIPSA